MDNISFNDFEKKIDNTYGKWAKILSYSGIVVLFIYVSCYFKWIIKFDFPGDFDFVFQYVGFFTIWVPTGILMKISEKIEICGQRKKALEYERRFGHTFEDRLKVKPKQAETKV